MKHFLQCKMPNVSDDFTKSIRYLYSDIDFGEKMPVIDITFQVGEQCSFRCSYCYQTKKSDKTMTLETAKKAIDILLARDNEYIPDKIKGCIIGFIGGEPLLHAKLIEDIIAYTEQKLVEEHHDWLYHHAYSISSNGWDYFSEESKHLFEKYGNRISVSFTLDGNKELHDSCRVTTDGKPTYDKVIESIKDFNAKYEGGSLINSGTKVTLAPGNVEHTFTAVKHMLDLGYRSIMANCVYEEGWTISHAKTLYSEMKKIADYLLETELYKKAYVRPFDEDLYRPLGEDDMQCWCGGDGRMIAVDPDGKFYPCLRYMESSLGNSQKPLVIGDLSGLCKKPEELAIMDDLRSVTRRSQSTDECFHCPIATGCSLCVAYNYQVYGTVHSRATYICDTHKAMALANVYFWNKVYQKEGIRDVFVNHVPDEWALEVIGEEELGVLKELEQENAYTEHK